MNKKFLKHYIETNPEGTAQTYIFLVDNQDIVLNIVMSGYQALCLVQEDDGYYFSADSFIEEMRAIQFTGSCQCAYHYVACSGLCNGSVKDTGKLYQQRKVYRKNETVWMERKLDRETEAHHFSKPGWEEGARQQSVENIPSEYQ